jgi:hypothetical protein
MKRVLLAALIALGAFVTHTVGVGAAGGPSPECIPGDSGGCYDYYSASQSYYDPTPIQVTISVSWAIDRNTSQVTQVSPSLALPPGYSEKEWLQQGTVPSSAPITEIYQYTYLSAGQTVCHSVQITVYGDTWSAPSSPGTCL